MANQKYRLVVIPHVVISDELDNMGHEELMEIHSTYDLERRIFMLSPKSVELLILKYFGYKPGEISKIMGLTQSYHYPKLNRKLQEDYMAILKSER